ANATEVTASVCPLSARNSLPARSQRRTALSWLPETTRLPSGENARAVTVPLWPGVEPSSVPLAASHRVNVWSPVRERACLPSAVKPTRTAQEFTETFQAGLRVVRSQRVRKKRWVRVAESYSVLPANTRLPSGAMAAQVAQTPPWGLWSSMSRVSALVAR